MAPVLPLRGFMRVAWFHLFCELLGFMLHFLRPPAADTYVGAAVVYAASALG